MDRATTKSICHAVGERLRQQYRPENSQLPQRLQMLLEEMHRRDHTSKGH